MPFANPIIGGGGSLVYPQIRSPNFDIANPTASPTPSWAILKNGLAYFFGLVLQGGTISGPDYIFNSQGLFFYNGTPANGNLAAWFAPNDGTDGFGNTFTEGLNIGGSGQNVAIIPDQNSAFNITGAIAGILDAILTLGSGDTNQVVPGIVGSMLLNTGTATKQSTVLGSPLGSGNAAYIILESEDDNNDDTAIITLGTVSSPDNGDTLVYTPIVTCGPYYFLLYNGQSGTTVVTKTSGSGNIPIPAGVTVGKGESWGNGNEGGNSSQTNGGAGGGSGEYAAEPTLALTAGGNAAYVITAANSSSNTTLAGTSVTITAHPGTAASGSTRGNGGSGSGNTTHANGGNGNAPSGLTGGKGGTCPNGGGTGGNGGGTGASGSPGGAPGAGGGGAGAQGGLPANGAAGRVRLTYSTGVPGILLSIATASGTDQFGTTFPAGFAFIPADGNTYRAGKARKRFTGSQTIASTAQALVNNLQFNVQPGDYVFEGTVWISPSTAIAEFMAMGGSATLTTFFSTTEWIATNTPVVVTQQTAFGVNAPTTNGGSTTGRIYQATLKGHITVSVAGTFQINCACGSVANNATVVDGIFELEQDL